MERIFLVILLASSPILAEIDIQADPVKYGVFTTLGMFDADTVDVFGNKGALNKKPFTRLGGYIGFGATIEERTRVAVMLAALKYNSLPVTEGSAFTRNQSLAPGLGHAFVSRKFGNLDNPYLRLKLGDFPYSYSPAKNLGGHLYTSGAYPGYLWGNFWQLVNGTNYNAQGLLARLSFLENSLTADVTAFIEHGIEPHFDLSPGLVVAYKLGEFAEFGAGAVFAHLISVDEDLTTPKIRENAYTSLGPLDKDDQQKPGLEPGDTLLVLPADPRAGQSLPSTDPRYKEFTNRALIPKYYTVDENGTPNSQLSYYTFRGAKVMGRISITPLEPLGENLDRPAVYGEVTLLGVKNYPFYYNKKSDRMPLLFGFDLPLPGVELNVEVEHYKNKFRNHIQEVYEFERPIWHETRRSFVPDSVTGETAEETGKDNGVWFWSATVRKTVFERLTFSLKVARDHMRPFNFFVNPTYEPAFKSQNSWYMVFKTEVNM